MVLPIEEIKEIAKEVADKLTGQYSTTTKCAEAGIGFSVMLTSLRRDLDRIRTDPNLAADYMVSINQYVGALDICGKKYDPEVNEQLLNLAIAVCERNKAEIEEYLTRIEAMAGLPIRGAPLKP